MCNGYKTPDAYAILEDILKTEDDIDRTERGLDLAQALFQEYNALYIEDRAEANVAVLTFFVHFLAKLTPTQREGAMSLLRIADAGMGLTNDTVSLCDFLRDKLKKLS